MKHINYLTNLIIIWENLVFQFCPNVAKFSKNVLSARLDIFKENIGRTWILRWLGRESVENVARKDTVVVGPSCQRAQKLISHCRM